jgi:hypothetical protein
MYHLNLGIVSKIEDSLPCVMSFCGPYLCLPNFIIMTHSLNLVTQFVLKISLFTQFVIIKNFSHNSSFRYSLCLHQTALKFHKIIHYILAILGDMKYTCIIFGTAGFVKLKTQGETYSVFL